MDPMPRDLPQLRRRLRRVMEHIGHVLQQPADAAPDRLSLPALAAVACWSPEHLDRIYRRHVGEPPLSTVRRLRLQRAAEALLAGDRLATAAEAAGYASTQAFGRAFQRCFGEVPSQWVSAETARRLAAAPAPVFTIVQPDEAMACHLLHYEGEAAGISPFFDEVVDRLSRSGSPRAQWQVFGIGNAVASRRPGARVSLQAAVLAGPLACPPAGFGRGTIARGAYARQPARRAAFLPARRAALLDDRRFDEQLREAGWQRTGCAILRHYDTDPAQTPPPERREWLYVPVAPR
jgi:AraC family transcriptional regulator